MSIQLPILYKQGDGRWALTLLGFNTDAKFNFANYACLLCCWAMIDRYYGKDTDPARLNVMFKDMGTGKAFVANGGDYIPGGNNLAYGDIKETRVATPSLLSDTQMGDIKTSIDNGYPVIIGIDYDPRDVDYDSHFVIVVDYNSNEENDLTIADPITGTLRSLKNYLGWFKPNARNTIESYIITTGPKPKFNNETLPVLKTDFERLVKKSGEYDKTVAYLKPGSDPDGTPFEDLQAVVAGIKSRQTDLESKLNDAIIARDLAYTEIDNLNDKIANLSTQHAQALKLMEAEITALKATIPDMAKLEGTYKATIDTLEGKLRAAQKTVGLRDLDITKLKAELKTCESGIQTLTAFEKVIKWIQDIINK